MNRSHNTLILNQYREANAAAKANGIKIYEQWITGATAEGYLGDKAIYDDVAMCLRDDLYLDFIIDACYNLNNFDKVEVYYSFPKLAQATPKVNVLGGLLYTIEVTRSDSLLFHQGFYLHILPEGLRILGDTFQPFHIHRGTPRAEMLGKGCAVIAGMIARLDEWFHRVNIAMEHRPDGETLLKNTHISKSARESILTLFQNTDGTLLDLALSAARYAHQLSYEEGLKYSYVAGRLLYMS